MDVERVQFLFGPDALERLQAFDLEDESDRIEIVEQFAPLAPDAHRRRARMTMRTVAVNQILDDDPPDTWRTAQRLRDLGLDRNQILSQLSMAISEHLLSAASSRQTFDRDVYVKALDGLPLPDGVAVARCLVELARSEPGIAAEAHDEAAMAALGPGGEALRSMIDDVVEHLVEGPLHLLPDDRIVVIPDLVDGATFTHRLTETEFKLEVLSAGFDFGALSRFDTVRLPDGTELDQFSANGHDLGWRGPADWLARFEPGDLLACTAVVDSIDEFFNEPMGATVTIEAIDDESEIDGAVIDKVRAGYDELVAEPWLPVEGGELVWWLLFHHSDLFDSCRRPLSELCTMAGLDFRAGRVAHDEDIWRNDLAGRRFFEVAGLVPEPQWREVLARALKALDDPDASVDDVRDALDACAEPETLDVLADVLFGRHLEPDDKFERGGADSPARLFDLVDRATTVARRPRAVATAEYLACVLHERCGDPELAEQHLQRAAKAQPRLGPVVERIGWYRFDRGDAQGAMRWWRTLSEPPQAAQTIQPFLDSGKPRHTVGRNDPCWCGSGRKYKQCHQGAANRPPLPERVGWLCRKASVWLEHTTGDVRQTVLDLATARATGELDVDPSAFTALEYHEMGDLYGTAFADPIVFDAALHEGGLSGLFLRERGPLLPDDERLLAASWQSVDRSVHEVASVDPGVGMTLRDLNTGDVVIIAERTLSTQAEAGDRYCARVVSDGESHQIIGGVFAVPTGRETYVLDLCATNDPMALCAHVGALHRPPRVVHEPGLMDEMFDRDAIEAVLGGHVDDSDPDTAIPVLQAELTRQATTRWLDEQVPALAGLTPRQAAADPTRREQLERLLAEFDSNNRRREEQSPRSGDGLEMFGFDMVIIRRELGLS